MNETSAPPVEWREIPEWPEYEVSEFGAVRRAMDGHRTYKGRELKPRIRRRYPSVVLARGPLKKVFFLHALVARAFLPPKPSQLHQVAHRDGNRDNNHWSNLRWATPQENQQDRIAHGTHNKGERHWKAKLVASDVLEIRRLMAAGGTRKEVAAQFSVTTTHVDYIVARKCWAHI